MPSSVLFFLSRKGLGARGAAAGEEIRRWSTSSPVFWPLSSSPSREELGVFAAATGLKLHWVDKGGLRPCGKPISSFQRRHKRLRYLQARSLGEGAPPGALPPPQVEVARGCGGGSPRPIQLVTLVTRWLQQGSCGCSDVRARGYTTPPKEAPRETRPPMAWPAAARAGNRDLTWAGGAYDVPAQQVQASPSCRARPVTPCPRAGAAPSTLRPAAALQVGLGICCFWNQTAPCFFGRAPTGTAQHGPHPQGADPTETPRVTEIPLLVGSDGHRVVVVAARACGGSWGCSGHPAKGRCPTTQQVPFCCNQLRLVSTACCRGTRITRFLGRSRSGPLRWCLAVPGRGARCGALPGPGGRSSAPGTPATLTPKAAPLRVSPSGKGPASAGTHGALARTSQESLRRATARLCCPARAWASPGGPTALQSSHPAESTCPSGLPATG